jgi:hypothetical protein
MEEDKDRTKFLGVEDGGSEFVFKIYEDILKSWHSKSEVVVFRFSYNALIIVLISTTV